MACLDTTILIDLIGKTSLRKQQAIRKLEELVERGEVVATTRFNVAELYVGVARSKRPEEDEKTIQTLLSQFEILEFNDTSAHVFGSLTGYLQRIGKPAGDMDVLIAATAMVHGHSLVTRNSRHFKHIPHLVVERY